MDISWSYFTIGLLYFLIISIKILEHFIMEKESRVGGEKFDVKPIDFLLNVAFITFWLMLIIMVVQIVCGTPIDFNLEIITVLIILLTFINNRTTLLIRPHVIILEGRDIETNLIGSVQLRSHKYYSICKIKFNQEIHGLKSKSVICKREEGQKIKNLLNNIIIEEELKKTEKKDTEEM
ncbi:hypothetical protein AN396_08870 [Candidatus Epulonipiscium fishelsonii]|uniref:Uncharacterized protein n=1 Tax=Candidatus Epulonipiscium fishelsonii TaxID=77094 RepID=A0ACC8XAL5_9FIRM|nr:hypothetical protein AN396_08870 [Epulopiscium sp. SCG-B11WGA-EpuloA1]